MIWEDDTQQLPPPCHFFTEQQDCEDHQCCWYESTTNVSQSSCNDYLQASFNNDASIILIMWAAFILMFSMIMVFGFIKIVIYIQNIRHRRRIRQQQLFFLQMGLYPRNERVFALGIVQRIEPSPEIITEELPMAEYVEENIVFPQSFAVREIDV